MIVLLRIYLLILYILWALSNIEFYVRLFIYPFAWLFAGKDSYWLLKKTIANTIDKQIEIVQANIKELK